MKMWIDRCRQHRTDNRPNPIRTTYRQRAPDWSERSLHPCPSARHLRHRVQPIGHYPARSEIRMHAFRRPAHKRLLKQSIRYTGKTCKARIKNLNKLLRVADQFSKSLASFLSSTKVN